MATTAAAVRRVDTSEMASKKQPNPIDVHVGSRVRLRRMMLGMSQEKLGENLGITFQQIQKYEKGTNRIGASRLQHIARVLSMPVSYFFEGAPGLSAAAAMADGLDDTPPTNHVVDFLSTT
jgi:transcriptional regulator with XRE-family HTH domain